MDLKTKEFNVKSKNIFKRLINSLEIKKLYHPITGVEINVPQLEYIGDGKYKIVGQ